MIFQPSILQCPNVPKPMHGLAPREIMGRQWWDLKRKQVYASTNCHCKACGAAGRMEAHEFWKINYNIGECIITEIVPLCYECHNFIHSGRLLKVAGTQIPVQKCVEILERGFKILAENDLDCFEAALMAAKELGAKTYKVKPYPLPDKELRWKDWYLVWNGKIYRSRFNDFEQWQDYYNSGMNPSKINPIIPEDFSF